MLVSGSVHADALGVGGKFEPVIFKVEPKEKASKDKQPSSDEVQNGEEAPVVPECISEGRSCAEKPAEEPRSAP